MFVFKLLLLYNYLILFCANSEVPHHIPDLVNTLPKDRLARNINEKPLPDTLLNKISNREYSIDNEDDDEDEKIPKVQHHHSSSSNNQQQQHSANGTHGQESTRKKPAKKNGDDLIINTENGRIRGKAFYTDHHIPRHMKPRNYPFGRKKYRVNAWLGIPYAEKPVDNLRFKRPVPIKNWDGILNTTELPNSCYQVEDTVIENFEGVDIWNPNTAVSEDCLYLNVWAPHPMPKNSPVMVITRYLNRIF